MEIFFEGGADFIGGDVKGGKRTADCNFSGGRVQAGVDQSSIIQYNTHADPLLKKYKLLKKNGLVQLRDVVQKKPGTCGNFSQVGDPHPLPPVWECHVFERKNYGLFCILGP